MSPKEDGDLVPGGGARDWSLWGFMRIYPPCFLLCFHPCLCPHGWRWEERGSWAGGHPGEGESWDRSGWQEIRGQRSPGRNVADPARIITRSPGNWEPVASFTEENTDPGGLPRAVPGSFQFRANMSPQQVPVSTTTLLLNDHSLRSLFCVLLHCWSAQVKFPSAFTLPLMTFQDEVCSVGFLPWDWALDQLESGTESVPGIVLP